MKDWQTFLLLASPVLTVLIGGATFYRGSKGDEALNLARNIKSTFETQKDLISSQGTKLERCEDKYEKLLEKYYEQHETIANLERQVGDLERTVKQLGG